MGHALSGADGQTTNDRVAVRRGTERKGPGLVR